MSIQRQPHQTQETDDDVQLAKLEPVATPVRSKALPRVDGNAFWIE